MFSLSTLYHSSVFSMSINAIGYRRNQKECSHFGQLMIPKSRTLFMRFQCMQNA